MIPGHVSAEGVSLLAGLRPLLGEINDLKRVRVAGRPGTLAEQGFFRSWAALIAGDDPRRVAVREATAARIAARLAGIDAATLLHVGLDPRAIASIFRRALGVDGQGPHTDDRSGLDGVVTDLIESALSQAGVTDSPPFLARLASQPRAGATRPGYPRLVLEPSESHAEHCYVTAVYGVLAAPHFDAEPGAPFLAGLSHHLHNAHLPDAGFAGEELLGEHLAPVMRRLTDEALAQLPAPLAAALREARTILDHADSPEARSFHAADVLDRVLQMDQYSRVAAFELRQALEGWDLVHPGPLQAFHLDVLAAAGLWS